jgi:hypothetical protein
MHLAQQLVSNSQLPAYLFPKHSGDVEHSSVEESRGMIEICAASSEFPNSEGV